MKPSTLRGIGSCGILVGGVGGLLVGYLFSWIYGVVLLLSGIIFCIDMMHKGSMLEESKKQTALLVDIYNLVRKQVGGTSADSEYFREISEPAVPDFISRGKMKN